MIELFKKDTSGKIRYLQTWTDGNVLHQVTGVVGTENPVPHSKICTPKNVGRSNETSGAQQAILEMESLVAEKLKGGYFYTAVEAEAGDIVLPMLAKDFKKEVKKINWDNAYAQPKLDGMRSLGSTKLTSREGTDIVTVPHLLEVLSQLPLPEGVYLDGELYSHGVSFQENMRLTKKYRPGLSEVIHYHVYDLITAGNFKKRYDELCAFIEAHQHIHKGLIEIVPTIKVTNEAELKKVHAEFVAKGYEGTMVRWGEAEYKKNGRSSNLLKNKDFLDLACTIQDFEPAKDRPTWGVPVFTYKGQQFRAGMKYSHAEREEFLKNKEKYIGQVAELRFFEWTEDGIPRFPVMVGIRLDKSKGDK